MYVYTHVDHTQFTCPFTIRNMLNDWWIILYNQAAETELGGEGIYENVSLWVAYLWSCAISYSISTVIVTTVLDFWARYFTKYSPSSWRPHCILSIFWGCYCTCTKYSPTSWRPHCISHAEHSYTVHSYTLHSYAVHSCTLHSYAVHSCTVHSYTVHPYTVHSYTCWVLLFCALLCCALLCWALLYCVLLCCVLLYCALLYWVMRTL